MNIFITGVAGFLGSNLADYYLNQGFEVSGCDNLKGGDLENVSKKVKFFKADCEDFKVMSSLIKNVDIVVHAAAYAHESLSVFSPFLISKNIINGSSSVFSAAIQNKVKRIVFCSSIARYGHISIPYEENSDPNPVDPYGISKLAAEKILINLCKTYDVEYNIAVPHNIIGIKQKYDDPFRNVASIMINLMLQNRQPIIYGDGEQKRSFSDVDDCIYCIDKLVRDPEIKNEIVNIGPDDNFISVNELFNKLSNKMQFNKGAINFKDRINEVKLANCSADKAKKIMGYRKSISLDDSLSKMINYIEKNGPKKFKYNYELEIVNEKTPKTWLERKF